MNQTSPSDISELPPVQKMTRRGFIKRTAATALAVVLAMNAFEAEAAAADEGGSSGKYLLELVGWPEANITYWAPDGHQEIEFNNIDKKNPPENYGGYGWEISSVAFVSPNEIASTKQADGNFHFMTSSFSVNITAKVKMYQGQALVYESAFPASG